MASAGSLLTLELVGSSGTGIAHTCPSTGYDVASCRTLPANSCPVMTAVVRRASTGKQRSLTLRERGFSRIYNATRNEAMSCNSVSSLSLTLSLSLQIVSTLHPLAMSVEQFRSPRTQVGNFYGKISSCLSFV